MPVSKTYVYSLRIVLKTAHRYATRYQTKIEAHISPAAYTCLVDTIAAIASCLVLLGEQEYNP